MTPSVSAAGGTIMDSTDEEPPQQPSGRDDDERCCDQGSPRSQSQSQSPPSPLPGTIGRRRPALSKAVVVVSVVVASSLVALTLAFAVVALPIFDFPEDVGGDDVASEENHRNLYGFTPFVTTSGGGRNRYSRRDRCRPWCRLADAKWLDSGLLRTGGEEDDDKKVEGDVDVLLENADEQELELRRRRYKCDWTYHCSGCPECANVPQEPPPLSIVVPPPSTSPGAGGDGDEGEDGEDQRPPMVFPCDEEVCYDLSSEERKTDDEICRFHSCKGCPECSSSDETQKENDGPSGEMIDGGVEFYALADTPYDDDQLRQLMKSVGRVPSSGRFLVHLGDMQKPKYSLCGRTQYEVVSYVLRQSPIPVFVLPGDNDFNDCPDVDRAVRYFDRYFGEFDTHWIHDINVTRQENRTTNFAFVLDRVLFMGVNVVGGTIHDEEEWRTRHADDAEWVRHNLVDRDDEFDTAVLFGHAAPSKRRHSDFFPVIEKYVEDMGDKPFLYLHGDGHRWHIRENAFRGDLENAVWVQLEGEMAPALKVTVGDGRDVGEEMTDGRKRRAIENFRFDRTATDDDEL